MPDYVVRWDIDVHADTPEEAAQQAREIQRDRLNLATVYNVAESDPVTAIPGPWTTVDLAEPAPPPAPLPRVGDPVRTMNGERGTVVALRRDYVVVKRQGRISDIHRSQITPITT